MSHTPRLAALILFAQFSAGSVYGQVIFDNSFEDPYQIVTVLLDTVIPPDGSATTSDGTVQIDVTGPTPVEVVVSEAVNEIGQVGYLVETVGDDFVIKWPESAVAPDEVSQISRIVDLTLQLNPTAYPDQHWKTWNAEFLSLEVCGLTVIQGGRLPQYNWVSHVTANAFMTFLDGCSLLNRIFTERRFFRTSEPVPASLLNSDCAFDSASSSCYADKTPILFIHGFQPYIRAPELADNGGPNYWGEFPARLRDLNGDTLPDSALFEFKWVTNARFQDVALDLGNAIELIYQKTGKPVHLVAHSFGGLLVRALLQHIEPVFLARRDHIAAMIASVTTIGTPHSGVADSANEMHGVDFPDGQHNGAPFNDIFFGFELCAQISCNLAGESKWSEYLFLESLYEVPATPGSLVAQLADTATNDLPALPLQVLIGFVSREEDAGIANVTYRVSRGDLLITGWGQRFHPELAVERWGPELTSLREKWDPLVSLPPVGTSNYGSARVVEYILGRRSSVDGEILIEPELELATLPRTTPYALPFVPYVHSEGIDSSKKALMDLGEERWDLLEPKVALTDNYHDAVQRVRDWIAPGSEPPLTQTSPLNDTGIDWGGDYPTGNNADCTGETIAAQDCSQGRDATHNDDLDGHAGFSFTKLDANGNTLPASATEWSCVRDNVTGLTWESKTDDGGLRDTDNTYSWYNPDSSTNGGSAGVQNGGSCTGSDCDTYSYVQAINGLGQALCGARDWRMPWREELRSIVDYSRASPAIDTTYFPYQRSPFVWTGSPLAGSSNGAGAWLFYFIYGGSGNIGSHGAKGRVRLVRGGQ